MSVFVSVCFLFKIPMKGFRQVYTCLVGEAEEYPKHIGHLVCKVAFFALLEGLVTIFTCHDTCQFTHFFSQYGNIGQLAEVAHAVCFNPAVYFFLCFFQCHIILCFLSPYI